MHLEQTTCRGLWPGVFSVLGYENIEHEGNKELMNDARWDIRETLVDEILRVSYKAGLVQVTVLSGSNKVRPYVDDINGASTTIDISPICEGWECSEPLKLSFLASNGKERVIKDTWLLFKDKPTITIPGSNIVVRKQSDHSHSFEKADESEECFI